MSNKTSNKTSSKQDWKKREMGALWRKESQEGGFYSGEVSVNGESVKIVVFKNKFKTEDSKEPDLRIYLSQEKQ